MTAGEARRAGTTGTVRTAAPGTVVPAVPSPLGPHGQSRRTPTAVCLADDTRPHSVHCLICSDVPTVPTCSDVPTCSEILSILNFTHMTNSLLLSNRLEQVGTLEQTANGAGLACSDLFRPVPTTGERRH